MTATIVIRVIAAVTALCCNRSRVSARPHKTELHGRNLCGVLPSAMLHGDLCEATTVACRLLLHLLRLLLHLLSGAPPSSRKSRAASTWRVRTQPTTMRTLWEQLRMSRDGLARVFSVPWRRLAV